MLSGVFALAWMLSGLPPAEPATDGNEAAAVQSSENAAALAEYNALREKTPNSADAQWKLALWCEKKGLKAESLVHLGAVLKLDPKRSAVWEKLGFKKRDGRWVNDEQIREDGERRKADKEWIARFRKWHGQIHGGPKQAEAEAAMGDVVDPRAVPAIWYVFGRRGPVDQLIAAQLLGQINSADSSKGLAILGVYGTSADFRARATQTLRQRDAKEYLGTLTSLLTDLLKFTVQEVGGPGSPGILKVEGERFSVRRFYAPPAPPMLEYHPGDVVSYDEFGLPTIFRPSTIHGSTKIGQTGTLISGGTATYRDYQQGVRYSLGEGLLAAQLGAIGAQEQLRDDVKEVEGFNLMRKAFNEHVLDVARAALGEDFGKDPMTWRMKTLELLGFSTPETKKDQPKPMMDLLVPLDYQPVFGRSYLATSLRAEIVPPDN